MTAYEITDLLPPLDQLTPGVDEPWLITATVLDGQGVPLTVPAVDSNGQPVYDEAGSEVLAAVTVSSSWWTSGGWNWFPPQAYDPAGNRYATWEDPPGSAAFTSLPRTASLEEIEPQLRAYVMDAAVAQWEANRPQQ